MSAFRPANSYQRFEGTCCTNIKVSSKDILGPYQIGGNNALRKVGIYLLTRYHIQQDLNLYQCRCKKRNFATVLSSLVHVDLVCSCHSPIFKLIRIHGLKRNAQRVLVVTTEVTRPRGRPKPGWEENRGSLFDVTTIGCHFLSARINVAQSADRPHALLSSDRKRQRITDR